MSNEKKQPQCTIDCDAVMSEFKVKIEGEYDEGRENFVTAKKMYQDMEYHIHHDLVELKKKGCSKESAERDLKALMARQDPLWTTFVAKAEAQKARVQALYEKLSDAEKVVDKERGINHAIRAWGALPTEEQEAVRKYHARKLVPNLKAAKEKVDEFIGYPDGVCVRVKILNKQVHDQYDKALAGIQKMEV